MIDGRGKRALLALVAAVRPAMAQHPTAKRRDGGARSIEAAPAGFAGDYHTLRRELCVCVLRVAALLLSPEHGPKVAQLREQMGRGRRGWRSLCAMFAEVPGGAGLFREGGCPTLERLEIDDAALAPVLDALLLDEADPPRRFDWRAAPIERLGAIYEHMLGAQLTVSTGPTVLVGPEDQPLDLQALLEAPRHARTDRCREATGWSPPRRMRRALEASATIDQLAAALERAGQVLPRASLHLQNGAARRRAGAHYTPVELARQVVEAALAPLLRAGREPLEIVVCDPAMGSGAFLLEACRFLADAIDSKGGCVAVLHARRPIASGAGTPPRDPARRAVAARCLRGVDADTLAVDVARTSLCLLVGEDEVGARAWLEHALQVGDALVGSAPGDSPQPAEVARLADRLGVRRFDWQSAFPEVFARGPAGFDACIGNPPWVAYVGRAAEPLDDDLFDYYRRHSPAFHGYRTLHGLFIHRAATLLRAGGRLGLIVPTSVSDLMGYEPTRRAHDALCDADLGLPDFGADAFRGVFQPAMALLSTRRSEQAPLRETPRGAAPWRLARTDLDPITEAVLERMSAMPALPGSIFGERGFQTSGGDAERLRSLPEATPPFVLPMREGADIATFLARPPRLYLDPTATRSRLRPVEQYREVRLLIRQTARFPIAALGDGLPFRNSILAGFAADGLAEFELLAWLNAAPIRWYHYMKNRDARQGMPQVKIAHLRALPAPPAAARGDLAFLGERLGKRNAGASQRERHDLDLLVADLLDMDAREREAVASWAQTMSAP